MSRQTAHFYNRPPWNLVVAVILIVIAFLQIARHTTLWVLAVPLVLWAYWITSRECRRILQLQRVGYFSGTQIRNHWMYEEREGYATRAMLLPVENTEPGHWELFIPDEETWRDLVPTWAAERRAEIASRIAQGWNAADVHMPADLTLGEKN